MSNDLLVRTSERTAFNRCRWAWEREFTDRLKPVTPRPPLRFGSLIHAALADYYRPGLKRGPKPAATFQKLYDLELKEQAKFGFRDDDGEWHEAGELGVAMLEGYIDEYGKDDRYRVLVTEQPFKVPVREPQRNGSKRKVLFYYVGVLDGVWEDREHGRLVIPDHKTAVQIRHPIPLDNQATAYWTYGVAWLHRQGLLDKDAKLAGMLYNFLRKAMPDPREQNAEGLYLNKDKSVSKKQPAPLFAREVVYRDEADRLNGHERVLQEVAEMNAVREGELPARKHPDAMICPMCSYRDICELHETGSDWEEMAEATMTTWDPYAEHEVYAGR